MAQAEDSAASEQQAEPAGPGTKATGIAKKNSTAWTCFGIGLVVAIVLAAAALFDFGPFAGEGFLAAAGWLLAAVLHGSSAALLFNIARPQPPAKPKTVIGDLSRQNLPDSRRWTLLPTVPVLLATLAFDFWIASLNLATLTKVVYVIAAIVGVGVLAVPTGKASAGKSSRVKYAGAATGGGVTGVVFSLAVLVGSSLDRHASLTDVSFAPLHDVPLHGAYVALGDSYAAGEGLSPFEPDTVKSGCHRSMHDGYSQLLAPHLVGVESLSFKACSGSVVADVYNGHSPNGVPVPAQVAPGSYPNVALVTIMSGGNDVGFSKVVQQCYKHANCSKAEFTSGKPGMPPRDRMDKWAQAALKALAREEHSLYLRLRASFPNARVIVIGYPYLFTAGPATLDPDDCASVTRRFSQAEREWVRDRVDELNNMLYAETVETGLEYISPHDAWAGHEPCGSKGEYTNEINFGQLSGSFHPNRNGARQLAELLNTYLRDNPTPPSPYVNPNHGPLHVTQDYCPSTLGLKPPFGDASPNCP